MNEKNLKMKNNFLLYIKFMFAIISKNLLGILLVLFIIIGGIYKYNNGGKKNPDLFYYDIDMKIVSFGNDCSLTNDKFQKPQLCNSVLLVYDDSNYVSLNSCNLHTNNIHLNIAWFYNHKKGDKVHFDYILKKRFFKIKKNEN